MEHIVKRLMENHRVSESSVVRTDKQRGGHYVYEGSNEFIKVIIYYKEQHEAWQITVESDTDLDHTLIKEVFDNPISLAEEILASDNCTDLRALGKEFNMEYSYDPGF